jgi:hypothetical protein
MPTISLNLPDDLLARLGREAKARRMTKSSLVREILVKRFFKESAAGALSCYDVARDLAGSVRRLPEDLAVNPEYMKDFGR